MNFVNLSPCIKELIGDRSIVEITCQKSGNVTNYEIHLNDRSTLSVSIYSDGREEIADKLKEPNVHNSN